MCEMRNLLPNPKPTDTNDWTCIDSGNMLLQMLSDNRVHITNKTAGSDRLGVVA